MRGFFSCLVILGLVASGLAADLVGTWKAKSMGSREGSIIFNRDMTYKLELKFKTESLIQSGKYKLKDGVLTLIPSKGAMADNGAPITLKLTWKDANNVFAAASRPGRKMTEFFFSR